MNVSVSAPPPRIVRAPAWPFERALGSVMLIAMLGLWGCQVLKPKAKDEGACDADHPCAEGQVCVPQLLGGARGRCARECASDEACSKGERCTGRYQKIGTIERFCREAKGGQGEPCAAPLMGCQEGLRCFAGRCERECRKDDECAAPKERCLQVVVDAVVERDRVEVFSACLPAEQAEGQPCKASGPFCGRGLVCHGEVCTRTCQADSECPKGRVCDGALFFGDTREERARKKEPPDVRYCREGAKRNQPCHHHLDVGCAAGLSCVGFRCREVRHVGADRPCDLEKGTFCQEGLLCHGGACRRPCLTDRDCTEAPKDSSPGSVEASPTEEEGASKEAEASSPVVKERPQGRRARRRAAHRAARPKTGLQCREVTLRNQPLRLCM